MYEYNYAHMAHNKRIAKQMDGFIANHPDIIAEYDMIEGVMPFDYCKYEIMTKMAQFSKLYRGCDFKTIIYQALQNAINYGENVSDALSAIITTHLQESGGVNTTQTYFREIGELYRKHKGDLNLEYCPENRERLIELNTKMVVSVAKTFQGLGLTLPELISAGNLGLCTAWEKYDASKAQIKDTILAAVEDIPDRFEYDDLMARLKPHLQYGKLLEQFSTKFGAGQTYNKQDLIKWIESNVHNAKFSSIAMMWIRAFILAEIDNNSRVVKKPKSEIYKDKEIHGAYQKETLLNLDSPIANDTDTTFADTLGMEDDTTTELEVTESYDEYKSALNKLLEGVNTRDRTTLLSKYGIGLPRPLTPKEISNKLNLSVARVSQICLNVLAKMRENATKYDIDPSFLFDCCTKFR